MLAEAFVVETAAASLMVTAALVDLCLSVWPHETTQIIVSEYASNEKIQTVKQ